jgi:hypothetical protein
MIPETKAALQALMAHWRKIARRMMSEHLPPTEDCPHAYGFERCADELEALIAESPHLSQNEQAWRDLVADGGLPEARQFAESPRLLDPEAVGEPETAKGLVGYVRQADHDAQIAAMRAERDQWRQWYEALMATRMTEPEARADATEAALRTLTSRITDVTNQMRSAVVLAKNLQTPVADAELLTDWANDLDNLTK